MKGPQRHYILDRSAGEAHATRILVLNPNSSLCVYEAASGVKSRSLMTQAVSEVLAARGIPSGTVVTCATAPPSSPPSINDPPTSIASTSACLAAFQQAGRDQEELDLTRYDAVLVACFSSHPLVGCLRTLHPSRPSMHILESALSAALSSTLGRFGILTTGRAMVADIESGVRSFLGGASDRYAGTIATGLPVLHLQDPQHGEAVKTAMRAGARALAERGAGAIILGCAGMAGMEGLVRSGVAQHTSPEEAAQTAVIDGAIIGVHLLTGLARSNLSR